MELNDFRLPLTVYGRAEITRMQRELRRIDDFFVDAAKRKPGESITPPRITQVLDEITRSNKINLLEASGRQSLVDTLERVLSEAPRMHISFAAEPSPKAFETILSWFRKNVHPNALLSIGIQPAIAAGCVVRTSSKIFDFSLGVQLKKQEDQLSKLIEGAVRG